MSETSSSGWAYLGSSPNVTTKLTYDDGFIAVFNIYGSNSVNEAAITYEIYGSKIVIYDLIYANYGEIILSIEGVNLTTTLSDLLADAWVIRLNAQNDTFYGNDYRDVIRGGNGNDIIVGYGGNDSLYGDSGYDELWGGYGSDLLDGGAAADAMYGGAGNDVYIVDSSGDVVNESLSGSGGTDTVQSSVSLNLANTSRIFGNVENLTLQGTANLSGTGNGLANALTGNAGGNVLRGGGGADRVNGAGGNDKLYGDLGNDILTGGSGYDQFVFNTRIGPGNVDKITDFNVTQDTILLDNAVMAGLGVKLGTLSAASFWKSTTGLAHDSSDRIIYETDTGKLFYDNNGNAAGGAVHIATLNPKLPLTHADFLII